VITLPHPSDVQVATSHPDVERFRAAYWRVLFLRDRFRRVHQSTLDTFDTVTSKTQVADRIREKAYRRYERVKAALTEAEAPLLDLEGAALRVDRAATMRARLSMEARAANLARERAADALKN
jgi:uncharacterized protein (DUF2235 family)